MKRTIEIIICDACGRDTRDVKHNGNLGKGKITLYIKNTEGRSEYESFIDNSDLCLSCANQIEDTINEIKKEHNVE